MNEVGYLKKHKQYMILATEDYEGNSEVLKHHVQLGTKHFSSVNGRAIFEIKLDSTPEREIDVRQLALSIQLKYNLPEIGIWKKSSENEELFDIGLSFILEDESIELLLGCWNDWTFNHGLKELELKDQKLYEMWDKLSFE